MKPSNGAQCHGTQVLFQHTTGPSRHCRPRGTMMPRRWARPWVCCGGCTATPSRSPPPRTCPAGVLTPTAEVSRSPPFLLTRHDRSAALRCWHAHIAHMQGSVLLGFWKLHLQSDPVFRIGALLVMRPHSHGRLLFLLQAPTRMWQLAPAARRTRRWRNRCGGACCGPASTPVCRWVRDRNADLTSELYGYRKFDCCVDKRRSMQHFLVVDKGRRPCGCHCPNEGDKSGLPCLMTQYLDPQWAALRSNNLQRCRNDKT